MKIKIKNISPNNPKFFEGFRIVRILSALFLLVMLVRSCIHLFAPDGGAQSIAGINTDVEGGANLIAMLHQWGAIQLILALLLLALFFRYPGLTPMILLTMTMDPVTRFISGKILPLTSESTPPGERLNLPAFVFLLVLFIASLVEKGNQEAT